MKSLVPMIAILVVLVSGGFAQTPAGIASQAAAGENQRGTAAQNAGKTGTNSANNGGAQTPQGVSLTPAPAQPNQGDASDVADLLAPSPLPPNPTLSLIGGTVVTLDRVRNRLVVQAFGGRKMRVDFDERSHIYRDGVETTSLGLHKGERVYLDTMLYGSHVFARNINIETAGAQADVEGQIESVDVGRKTFAVRDKLTDQPVSLDFDAQTKISHQGRSGSAANLLAGALVSVHFALQGAGRPVARIVNVLADPGRTYIFRGEISHIDKHQDMIAIRNSSGDGDRFFDISVERTGVPNELRIGSTVKVIARFDGTHYVAQQISMEPARTPSASPSEDQGDQQTSPASSEKR